MPPLQADPFETVHAPPPLGADQIHVYLHTLATDCNGRAMTAAARTELDRLLCAYTGRAQAPALRRGAHGKPYAPDADGIEFNLSHCGPCLLLAFAREQALGVDIERLRARTSVLALARRFFDAEEAAALERLPESVRDASFLHLWTRKEAVLKALGDGLQFGLHRLAFAVDPDGTVGGLRHITGDSGAADGWRLRTFAPAEGVIGALAWLGPERRVRFLRRAGES